MGAVITLRAMTAADIPLGMRLKEAAGWNQTAADWQMMLACPGGAFVAAVDGVDAGTTTVVSYGDRFSWVGMVLVDPACRRRGVGTALLHAAIDYAAPLGPVRLDATPLGKQLYDTLGFRDEYTLARMERQAVRQAAPVQGEAGEVQPLAADRLSAVIAYDAPVFGAPRPAILVALAANRPEYAYLQLTDERVTGYCLGRAGSRFDQIGPIVADDEAGARSVLLAALGHSRGSAVIVDALAGHTGWMEFLHSLGFVEQRPFIRMCLGELRHPGEPARQYAIAGPEIG